MPTKRIEIDAALVEKAVAEAKNGVDGTIDYADIDTKGLVLRARGHSVSWLLKTRSATKKLGSPPAMGVRAARKKATEELPKLVALPRGADAAPPVPAEPVSPSTWTWDDLRTGYLGYLTGDRKRKHRVRKPSKRTEEDVSRTLWMEAFDGLAARPIASLKPGDIVDALHVVRDEHSHRQAEKALSYTKAALSWALSNRKDASGLSVMSTWWREISAPDPTPDQMAAMYVRQQRRDEVKLTVQMVGRLLAVHEDYCRSRVGRNKVSPAVRWGLWWVYLTASRRAASIALRRDAVHFSDERGRPGWGLVWWPAEVMKTKAEFWLPVPPLGLHILRSVQRDWHKHVSREHSASVQTGWVFASTRRIGRDDTNPDVCLAPSSLNSHLGCLRGTGQGRNHLEGIPHFGLHRVRDIATSLLLDRMDIAPGASSAMLAHQLPSDHDPSWERMSPTTRQFYDHAQRMPLKTEAMAAWSEALLDAFKDAGGVYPE